MKNRALSSTVPSSSDWTPLTASPECFRIALFGRRAAGKTCFLTAFNLPRTPHSAQLTCSLKPPSRNAGSPYRLGWEKIQKAAEQIRNGSAPEPTRNSDLLAFRLTLGSPETGDYKAEMFDYSGELLDSETTDTELASRLLARLQDSDAVVVLAEYAPELAPLAEELNRLGQAFNALKEKCPEIPVAFLVNKWDRNPAMADGKRTVEVQTLALRDFLESEPAPPHRRLRDQIQNATGKRFREFPVSAFGIARTETVQTEGGGTAIIETPALCGGQLESFGLEDALFWLIGQAEAAALERVREAEEESRQLFPRPIKKRYAALRLASREFLRFAPRGSASRTLSELKRKLERRVVQCVAVVASGLALIGFAFLLSWDEYRYRRLVLVIESLSSENKGIEEAEERLKRFGSPGYRYWVMHRYRPPSAIAKEIDASWKRRDQGAWEIVVATEPLASKATAALDYLDNFPNGQHRADSTAIVGEWEQKEINGKAKALADRVTAELTRLRTVPESGYPQEIGEIQALEKEIVVQEQGSISDPETLARLASLRGELTGLRSRFETGLVNEKFRKEFTDLMNSNRVIVAGERLVSLPPERRADFANEREYYKKSVAGMVGSEIGDLSQGGRSWERGRDRLNFFVENVVKRDPDLHPEAFMGTIENLERRVLRDGDRHLYSIVLNAARSDLRNALSKYISDAPVGTMRDHCERRLKYLEDIEKVHDVKLVLESIRWGVKVDKVKCNQVTVAVDGKTSERKGPHESTPGFPTLPTSNNEWGIGLRKFDESIRISVSAEDDGTGFWTNKFDFLGKADLSATLSSLVSGRTVTLEDATIGGTELHFRVKGFPPESPLPPYPSLP